MKEGIAVNSDGQALVLAKIQFHCMQLKVYCSKSKTFRNYLVYMFVMF